MHACLGVTCHLHFWQNERGLLRATAVSRGWNGHRIRVSTQSGLWRSKFSRRSCRDSNSQTFDHESGALTNKLCRLESLLHQQTASIHFRGSEVAGYFYITRCIGLFLLTNHFRQCIRCQPLCKEVNGIIGVSVRLSQSLVNRCPCLTPHVLLRGAFNCAVLF